MVDFIIWKDHRTFMDGEELVKEGNALSIDGALEIFRQYLMDEPTNIFPRRQPDVTRPFKGSIHVSMKATEYETDSMGKGHKYPIEYVLVIKEGGEN